MKNDLLERYVYAVAKRLPKKQREEVSMELHELLNDLVEARCGEMTPTEKDIKVVLTEFGTVSEVVAKYRDDSGRLIGEPYYTTYLYVMKIVLIVSLSISVAAVAIITLIDGLSGELSILELFGRIIAWPIEAVVGSFATVTIVFAVLDYFKVNITKEVDSIEMLPKVPKQATKKYGISKGEIIAELVLTLVFVIGFATAPLWLPQAISSSGSSFMEEHSTRVIVWIEQSMMFVMMLIVLDLVQNLFALKEKLYNKTYLIVSIATTAIGTVIAVIWGMSVEMFIKINGVFVTEGVQLIFITLLIIGALGQLAHVVYRYMHDNKVGVYNLNKPTNNNK